MILTFYLAGKHNQIIDYQIFYFNNKYLVLIFHGGVVFGLRGTGDGKRPAS